MNHFPKETLDCQWTLTCQVLQAKCFSSKLDENGLSSQSFHHRKLWREGGPWLKHFANFSKLVEGEEYCNPSTNITGVLEYDVYGKCQELLERHKSLKNSQLFYNSLHLFTTLINQTVIMEEKGVKATLFVIILKTATLIVCFETLNHQPIVTSLLK